MQCGVEFPQRLRLVSENQSVVAWILSPDAKILRFSIDSMGFRQIETIYIPHDDIEKWTLDFAIQFFQDTPLTLFTGFQRRNRGVVRCFWLSSDLTPELHSEFEFEAECATLELVEDSLLLRDLITRTFRWIS